MESVASDSGEQPHGYAVRQPLPFPFHFFIASTRVLVDEIFFFSPGRKEILHSWICSLSQSKVRI
jgi:hypothetical protein